jgi:hypothetical protein
MNITTKKLGTLVAAGFLMGAGSIAHAAIIDVTFGSDANGVGEGFAGFTASVENGAWTEQADSVRYAVSGSSNTNGSLMRELSGVNALSTSAGSSYTFTTVIDSTSGGDGNRPNRIALSMFANTGTAGDLNDTGIVVKLLTQDSASTFQINRGLSNFNQQKEVSWGGAALGESTFTLESTVSFTATDANISFTLTDADNFSDTMDHTIALTNLALGDFHGAAARSRTNGGTPFTMDVQSFTAIPEPSTLALLGIALGSAFFFRRRRK